jgi:hypothetical protein
MQTSQRGLTSLDAIDPAWVTDALRNTGYPDARVETITAEPLSTGGAWCDLRRLVLHYRGPSGGLPASVIAKSPRNGPAREVGTALGLFDREMRFYTELAAEVPLRLPRCFHPGDGDRGNEPLLLEDLTSWSAGNQLTGLTLEQTRAVLDDLAGMHARFWNSPRLAAADWLLRIDSAVHIAVMQQMAAAGIEPLRQRFTATIGSEAMERGLAVCRRFGDVLRAIGETEPKTLVHEDFRLDNILFGPGGERLVLDWQVPSYVRGVHDVAYLLTGSLQANVLSRHWEELLRDYHDNLVAAGVSDYPWEDLLSQYRQNVLYSFIFPLALASTLSLDSEHGTELGEVMVTRVFRHADEVNAYVTLP